MVTEPSLKKLHTFTWMNQYSTEDMSSNMADYNMIFSGYEEPDTSLYLMC